MYFLFNFTCYSIQSIMNRGWMDGGVLNGQNLLNVVSVKLSFKIIQSLHNNFS